MDQRRFDDVARSVASPGSRRGFLGGLAGLAAGLLGARAVGAQDGCGAGLVFRRGMGCVCRNTGRPPANGTCPCPTGPTTCEGGGCPIALQTCCPEAATLDTCTGSGNVNCYCVTTTEGSKRCHEGGQSCAQFGACTGSADCPAGTFCSADAGVCPGNVCLRGCNTTTVAAFEAADAPGERSPVL